MYTLSFLSKLMLKQYHCLAMSSILMKAADINETKTLESKTRLRQSDKKKERERGSRFLVGYRIYFKAISEKDY